MLFSIENQHSKYLIFKPGIEYRLMTSLMKFYNADAEKNVSQLRYHGILVLVLNGSMFSLVRI